MNINSSGPKGPKGPKGWCKRITLVFGALLTMLGSFGNQCTKQMLFLAALLSGVWVYWYGYDYKSSDQIRIDRFNITTWVCWTIGLMAAGLFYQAIKKRTNLKLFKRIALTGLLWFISIMIIEWIGYNKMGIKLKSNYPGLFGLELMHGPWYLKIYYLTAWMIFLSLLGIW